METYGEGSWSKLVPYFSGRIGKQLRERWNHELRPDIQKGAWTEDEERALVEQHRIHRNAWADIARVSPALSLHLTRVPSREMSSRNVSPVQAVYTCISIGRAELNSADDAVLRCIAAMHGRDEHDFPFLSIIHMPIVHYAS